MKKKKTVQKRRFLFMLSESISSIISNIASGGHSGIPSGY
jgi:hypothetical protein